MTRIAFMETDEKTYEFRSYIVRDDSRWASLLNCVNRESIEGRQLLEEIAVKLGVIELEKKISSSQVIGINC